METQFIILVFLGDLVCCIHDKNIWCKVWLICASELWIIFGSDQGFCLPVRHEIIKWCYTDQLLVWHYKPQMLTSYTQKPCLWLKWKWNIFLEHKTKHIKMSSTLNGHGCSGHIGLNMLTHLITKLISSSILIYRNTPTMWCLCAFTHIIQFYHFYVPLYMWKKKLIILCAI